MKKRILSIITGQGSESMICLHSSMLSVGGNATIENKVAGIAIDKLDQSRRRGHPVR